MRRMAMLLGAFLAVALVSAASAQGEVTIQLSAQNFSGINGQATLSDAGNNQTKVDIFLFNEPRDGVEPASIQAGPCTGTVGNVQFALGNVENAKKNELMTTVNASLASLQAGNLSLTVANGTKDTAAKVSVACADIPAVGATAAANAPAAPGQVCPKSPCGLQTPPTNAPAVVALPKTGGVPPYAIIIAAGSLLGFGYFLRRRSMSAP